MASPKICEGVFAINKPKNISSAQVLRDLQRVFNPSKIFAPWLDARRAERAQENAYQRKRRKDKHLQVKVGHGGTLDPMATGVLIIGVGKGTKQLQSFLECMKSYEATVLFGAASDTYDVLGKTLKHAPYNHITEAHVTKALEAFRGKIMQKPPLYSALRMQGKRLYEYAREGIETPFEIQERPVEVKELEIVEWINGGEHPYKWPSQEAGKEIEAAEKILHLQKASNSLVQTSNSDDEIEPRPSIGSKRKWIGDEDDDLVKNKKPPSKEEEEDPRFSMSGALQSDCNYSTTRSRNANNSSSKMIQTEVSHPIKPELNPPKAASPTRNDSSSKGTPPDASSISPNPSPPHHGPPAVKLRMTVTSGFYVRSLSHDLGIAIGSLGMMSNLVRTRQGTFELGRNALEWEDFSRGEEVWAPKMEALLEAWKEGEGEEG